jgi:hypothetical protein
MGYATTEQKTVTTLATLALVIPFQIGFNVMAVGAVWWVLAWTGALVAGPTWWPVLGLGFAVWVARTLLALSVRSGGD